MISCKIIASQSPCCTRKLALEIITLCKERVHVSFVLDIALLPVSNDHLEEEFQVFSDALEGEMEGET